MPSKFVRCLRLLLLAFLPAFNSVASQLQMDFFWLSLLCYLSLHVGNEHQQWEDEKKMYSSMRCRFLYCFLFPSVMFNSCRFSVSVWKVYSVLCSTRVCQDSVHRLMWYHAVACVDNVLSQCLLVSLCPFDVSSVHQRTREWERERDRLNIFFGQVNENYVHWAKSENRLTNSKTSVDSDFSLPLFLSASLFCWRHVSKMTPELVLSMPSTCCRWEFLHFTWSLYSTQSGSRKKNEENKIKKKKKNKGE